MPSPELLPPDAIARIRYPTQIFTEAYLNDPIRFEPDPRFNAESVTRQETDLPVVLRDYAEFLEVNLNSKTAIEFPVTMYRRILNRFDYDRVIDRTFTSF
jgi:hypothetical protein